MKKYIIKHSFLIGAIVMYCIPFICSFSVYQVFLLIEKHSELQNIDCSELYLHPNFLLSYFDLFIGLISIIGSIFLTRNLWDLFRSRWVKWTSCIIVFVTLYGFSMLVPWFDTNSRLHKNRVLLAVAKELKDDTEEIEIRFHHVLGQTNMFGENRDFDIYEIENISNDSALRQIELPIKSIKIQADITSLLEIKSDIQGTIVISNHQKKNFYFIDKGNNILGIDLEIIKNNP